MGKKSFLEMSDEEIANMEPSDLEPEAIDNDDETTDDTVEAEENPTETEESESEDDTEEESSEESEEENEEQAEEESGSEEPKETPDTEQEEPEEKSNKEVQTKDAETINYEQEYKRLMQPIKANGKEIQLKSIDEVISLVQMGANYTRKMSALKPHLKLLKTLENNKLLEENEISFLIDLKNKKPEAIARLLKDADINPLDIDVDLGKNYTPSNNIASDQSVAIDAVIDDLKDSPHFATLTKVVAKDWDNKSKLVIHEDPEILRQLHNHMIPDAQGNSIYNYVSSEVERRKVLGQLQGMSDYEAYIQVGNELYEQSRQQQAKANVAKRVVKPAAKPTNVDPETLKNKKLAAAPTKGKATPSKQFDFNPLSLSDEEIEKLSVNQY